MRRQRFSLLVLLGVLGLTAVPAQAQTAAETSPVVSTETQYRSAVATLSGDNSGPHTITLGADITITGATDPTYVGTQPLTIDGDGHTLSGGDTRRVLLKVGPSPLLTLTDIVVRDGFAATLGGGGAVYWGGPVDLLAMELRDNHVSGTGVLGGGGLLAYGDVEISNAAISGNSVTSTTINALGGAVTTYDSTSISVTGSVVESNLATAVNTAAGGAFFAIEAVSVTDSYVAHNTADGGLTGLGGAVRAGTEAMITGSQFWANEASGTSGTTAGGAVFAFDGVGLQRSTLWENGAEATSASAQGSAVFSYAGVELVDTTVTGNVAAGSTDQAAVWTGGDVTGAFSTIVGNEGVNTANLRAGGTLDVTTFAVGDPIGGPNCSLYGGVTATYSVDDDGTCGFGTGTGNLSDVDDLRVGRLRDNGGADTFATEAAGDDFPTLTVFPLAGSPLVDRRDEELCPDDQRGVARPYGAGCDAGAIEAVYPPHAFSDVPVWVDDAVRWLASDVNDPVLITGITPTLFKANDPITRGQVVRMLYREAGSPAVSGYPAHGFTDVPGWVEDAVRWAKGEGIATGITPTTFKANDPITRAQVVRMKYRFAGSPPVGALPAHPFTDVPAWAQESVRWAASTTNPLPLVTGITPTTFRPDDPITRGQVARMDYRLAITPAAWADPDTAPLTMPFRSSPGP